MLVLLVREPTDIHSWFPQFTDRVARFIGTSLAVGRADGNLTAACSANNIWSET